MVVVILYGSSGCRFIWICWTSGRATVDYRARPWLGDFPDVPHGVSAGRVLQSYHKSARNLPPLPDVNFKALTRLPK